jgi:hypothetical protein
MILQMKEIKIYPKDSKKDGYINTITNMKRIK